MRHDRCRVPDLWMPLYNSFVLSAPVIPDLYWDAMSYEQRIKAICEAIDKITQYANTLGIKLNEDHDTIEKLLDDFEDFKAGAYDDYYVQILEQWVYDHMPEIINQAIKMVFFGLTDDGYFCAYIPDAWSDIVFDTGMIWGQEDYGRLILKMQVDNTFNIEED